MPISEVTNEDCMEMMKRYPDKFFDLAIVDPPYGIGKFTCSAHTDENGIRKKNNKNYTDDYEWNDVTPTDDYFNELKRISKNRIIWGANYYNCFENENGAIVWYKGDMTKTLSHCEIASISNQKKVSYLHLDWQSGFFREMREGIQIHPCQKPISLYKYLLKAYSKQGDKILDTHLGSQSSRIAAYKLGFDFWGCEIDKDYFEQGNERFKKAIAEPLFDSIPETFEQTKLF